MHFQRRERRRERDHRLVLVRSLDAFLLYSNGKGSSRERETNRGLENQIRIDNKEECSAEFGTGSKSWRTMLRWQSSVGAHYDPRRASAGVPVNPDQFTDSSVPPQLPQVRWWQKATTYGAIIYCIFLGVYAVFVILSSWLPVLTPIAQAPLFAICNFFFLVFTGGLEMHLKKQLNNEQEQGYLRFSSHLDWLVYQPFGIVAYGGGAALVVVSWDLQQEMAIPHLPLLQLVILIQITWAAALVGVYIWKVHQHNMLHHQPDAMHSLYSPLQPPRSLAGIKYIDRGGLAEQQSIYIQSQQDNLQHLMKEYLRLWENLQKYKQSQDGSTTPQVDLVHLLATREQEIRAIAAERDFLQDEVRVARGVIWEKDSDMQSVRSVNDQNVEENERLRAELDEWSSRTAKERGLSGTGDNQNHGGPLSILVLMQAKFTAVMSLSWVLQLELALELELRSSVELDKKLLR